MIEYLIVLFARFVASGMSNALVDSNLIRFGEKGRVDHAIVTTRPRANSLAL
jgi:hypothetical protein